MLEENHWLATKARLCCVTSVRNSLQPEYEAVLGGHVMLFDWVTTAYDNLGLQRREKYLCCLFVVLFVRLKFGKWEGMGSSEFLRLPPCY